MPSMKVEKRQRERRAAVLNLMQRMLREIEFLPMSAVVDVFLLEMHLSNGEIPIVQDRAIREDVRYWERMGRIVLTRSPHGLQLTRAGDHGRHWICKSSSLYHRTLRDGRTDES